MHPIVYNVARQQFLAALSDIEANHLEESRALYENQSWYLKLSGFSDQTCLQQLRNKTGYPDVTKSLSERNAQLMLFRYNMGIDVSSLLSNNIFSGKIEKFWNPTSVEQFRYLQDHIGRVISSLSDQMSVSKEDLAGFGVKKYMMSHLQYILDNHPVDVLGESKQIEIMQVLATSYVTVARDVASSKQLLDYILQMQDKSQNTDPLDRAKTLTD